MKSSALAVADEDDCLPAARRHYFLSPLNPTR